MKAAERLFTAAAKLRAAGAAASKGPWRVEKHHRRKHPSVLAAVELHSADGFLRSVSTTTPRAVADVEWSAVVNPLLAEPFSAWLEWAAHQAEMNETRAPRHRVDLTEALAVATVILGGAQQVTADILRAAALRVEQTSHLTELVQAWPIPAIIQAAPDVDAADEALKALAAHLNYAPGNPLRDIRRWSQTRSRDAIVREMRAAADAAARNTR